MGELTCDYADGTDAEDWNGYTVFQVKHKEKLSDRARTNNASCLWDQVKADASSTSG